LQYGCSTLIPSPRAYRYGSPKATVGTIYPCAIMSQDKSCVQHFRMLYAGSILPITRSIVTDAVGGLEYPNSGYTAKLTCTIRRARDERQG